LLGSSNQNKSSAAAAAAAAAATVIALQYRAKAKYHPVKQAYYAHHWVLVSCTAIRQHHQLRPILNGEQKSRSAAAAVAAAEAAETPLLKDKKS